MTVANPSAALRMGRCLAELVRAEPGARRLWASSHRDYVELWVLTADVDAEAERRLHELGIRTQEAFPDGNLRIRLINPRFYEGRDPVELIPAGAEEIALRPA